MYVSVQFDVNEKDNIKKIVEERLPEILVEEILKDENKLRAIIRESVRGQLKAQITELLQGTTYKNFLRDKILNEIGLNEQ